jgi:hypothetical protein
VSQAQGTTAEGARPPLIATLGYSPWCSSNWNALYTRLWRISAADTMPKPLLDRTDGLYLGEYTPASAVLSDTDFLVQRYAESVDIGTLIRLRVEHFRMAPDDEVRRVSPVAFDPEGFVDEWLQSDWEEADKWLAPGAEMASLRQVHDEIKQRNFAVVFGDRPERCRGTAPLYQVELSMDSPDDRKPGQDSAHYFQVSWDPPYEFSMVRVGPQPLAGCDQPLSDAQLPPILLPEAQWQPNS